MPYVLNNNIAVRYEIAGDPCKPAIVLIFGMSMTCEDWVELGYVSPLCEHFHVVCIEPRGHGQSTCSTEPSDYSLCAMASDVETVIAKLKLSKPILWGYSLGAKIALATVARMPSAYSGLIVGGFELLSEVELQNDMVSETLQRGPSAWLALWRTMFDVPAGMANRLAVANVEALLAIRQAEGGWPSLKPNIASIKLPTLLYAADGCFFRDATAQAAVEFANARYAERPRSNHFELMLDSQWITNEVIADFASAE